MDEQVKVPLFQKIVIWYAHKVIKRNGLSPIIALAKIPFLGVLGCTDYSLNFYYKRGAFDKCKVLCIWVPPAN